MDNVKALITGANGFVGRKLMKELPGAVASPSLRNVSVEQVIRIVEESQADVIIHTAAVSDIGMCEQDPEGSYTANVILPTLLAKAAGGRKLICFSSDQVYGGSSKEGPYKEEDACPANTYAKQKLEMEERVLDICPDAVMLRAEWMYDFYSPKGNYFLNVLNAQTVPEFSKKQYRGITYVKEVADNMPQVIRLPGGIYNFGSETDKSIYDVTIGFLKMLGRKADVSDAAARHNLWMDCSKASVYGVCFREVMDGLSQCLKDMNRN